MKPFDSTHLVLLLCTVLFVALTMWLASVLSERGQSVLFAVGALLCAGGVFLRYAIGLPASFSGEDLSAWLVSLPHALNNIRWGVFARELLQVCNFNFVLVLLMLLPSCELARQYSVMFSMFAAATVMLSFPSSWATKNWYDPVVLNFWLNHVFAIALPLWMLAARRLKPKAKFILPVAGCVVAFFLAVYGISELLMRNGLLTLENTYSYVYLPEGVGLLEWLHGLIPVPCFYLAPLIPPMLGFFWLLARIFRSYEVTEF